MKLNEARNTNKSKLYKTLFTSYLFDILNEDCRFRWVWRMSAAQFNDLFAYCQGKIRLLHVFQFYFDFCSFSRFQRLWIFFMWMRLTALFYPWCERGREKISEYKSSEDNENQQASKQANKQTNHHWLKLYKLQSLSTLYTEHCLVLAASSNIWLHWRSTCAGKIHQIKHVQNTIKRKRTLNYCNHFDWCWEWMFPDRGHTLMPGETRTEVLRLTTT